MTKIPVKSIFISEVKKEIDGVTYLNCGDWIENNSAVVENIAGDLDIVYY